MSPPSSSINPNFLNFFMKKSTFERVVPAIFARVRSDTFGSSPRLVLHPVAGEQQQRPRQALLVVIEQLVEQVFLDPDVRAEHVRDEPICQIRLIVEQPEHPLLLQHEDGARGHERSRFPFGAVGPPAQPSPKNSPGPRMATTASLPCLERTESFTPPF